MYLLSADLVDSDLGVGHTSTESRFDVRFVLTVTVASGRSSSHFVVL